MVQYGMNGRGVLAQKFTLRDERAPNMPHILVRYEDDGNQRKDEHVVLVTVHVVVGKVSKIIAQIRL